MCQIQTITFSLNIFILSFYKNPENLHSTPLHTIPAHPSYYQHYFWRTTLWLFLIHSAPLSGSLSEICYKALWLLPYASKALGCAACLLSLGQEQLTARSFWDESQELSNSGEIPCWLYLEIKKAKRTVGQRIGGRPLRC